MEKSKQLILLLSIFAIVISSCSKVVIWDPDEEEIAKYSKIYIPQAERKSVVTITMNDEMTEIYEAFYNVFLGGPIDAPDNISVTFFVDKDKVERYNQENNTSFQLLPDHVFELSSNQVVINKGSRSSDNLSLKIIPDAELEVQNYLLPISIDASNASVNEDYATVYFIIKVPEKEVPRVKVLSLGSNWGNNISTGPDGVLYIRDNGNYMWVYKPDETGIYSDQPTRFPGEPWGASGWFYYIKDNIEFVVNDDGFYGMFRFDIQPDSYFLDPKETVNPADPWPNNFGFWYGDGWNKVTLLPQGDYLFFVNKQNGNLLRAPMDDFLDPYVGTWHKPGWIEDVNNIVATGFGVYREVISFKNNLMAVKSDGTLWIYPVSENGQLGSAKQIGTGWNLFKKIIVTEHGVLALDEAGDLYRFEIDTDEFYEL